MLHQAQLGESGSARFGAAALHAYKGRPKPVEPASAPAPAPKDGAKPQGDPKAPAPKPAEPKQPS
ncbi:putative polyhydroxybutyrate depolymerase [Methylocella silvestris BL2]|uniref:Putative polyhydroxybutyrate depolymerase n=1 Tax=Methylocella silvestris (strain DSM 15510 / CIP 108128 / LMG 27833 / NCIMB 13906 / BL2) TaxID=395965 RepID=B8EKF9_METSB|nr:hypothetical protein [Methylocella silvestris]ACK51329.1 putative polyhydroxybutyrate depolymerase [Methylocella silvestris BL2]